MLSTVWSVGAILIGIYALPSLLNQIKPGLFYLGIQNKLSCSRATPCVRLFSSQPLILHISDFMNECEMQHIVKITEGRYETSRIWNDEEGSVDFSMRVSESAVVPDDPLVHRIQERAVSIMGWRNNETRMEQLKVQRYHVNGFYSFHYDWMDPGLHSSGNRVSTFMVYLQTDCFGGGTNFPKLSQPEDHRWCSIIACKGDEEYAEYRGVTFKPISGSEIFLDYMNRNGTPDALTRHAGLPVRSGIKTSMNIWFWDQSWIRPENI